MIKTLVVTGAAVGKKSTDQKPNSHKWEGSAVESEDNQYPLRKLITWVKNNKQNENHSLISQFKGKLALFQNDGFLYYLLL